MPTATHLLVLVGVIRLACRKHRRQLALQHRVVVAQRLPLGLRLLQHLVHPRPLLGSSCLLRSRVVELQHVAALVPVQATTAAAAAGGAARHTGAHRIRGRGRSGVARLAVHGLEQEHLRGAAWPQRDASGGGVVASGHVAGGEHGEREVEERRGGGAVLPHAL